MFRRGVQSKDKGIAKEGRGQGGIGLRVSMDGLNEGQARDANRDLVVLEGRIRSFREDKREAMIGMVYDKVLQRE